jgi:zinc transport system permease protein
MFAEFSIPYLPDVARTLGVAAFELRALLAVVFITGACGMVGALVVGNRMAFFSDAMSHCAFAGISLGLILALSAGVDPRSDEFETYSPLVMAVFGAIIGLTISFVREYSGLASDTVIGVFFAGALGFGAIVLASVDRNQFDPEKFLFGGPILVRDLDLVYLALLLALTVGVMAWQYNRFVLVSLNPSLARSRGIGVVLSNSLFIVLLALVVNLSIRAVGVLLINAMLIVPAATASNVATSMRQLFRYTFALSVGCGLFGLYVSLTTRFGTDNRQIGPSGAIICLGVLLFAVSLTVPAIRTRLARLGG